MCPACRMKNGSMTKNRRSLQMENSYCLVFHHPVSQEITMLPRAPKQPERWKWRYARRFVALLVKYVI